MITVVDIVGTSCTADDISSVSVLSSVSLSRSCMTREAYGFTLIACKIVKLVLQCMMLISHPGKKWEVHKVGSFTKHLSQMAQATSYLTISSLPFVVDVVVVVVVVVRSIDEPAMYVLFV